MGNRARVFAERVRGTAITVRGYLQSPAVAFLSLAVRLAWRRGQWHSARAQLPIGRVLSGDRLHILQMVERIRPSTADRRRILP